MAIRAHTLPNGGVLITDEDNRGYEFSKFGEFVAERPPSIGVPFKYVSILSSGGIREAYVYDGESGTVREVGGGAVAAVMLRGGFVRQLTRRGEQDGVRYTQMIFMYPENFDLTSISF